MIFQLTSHELRVTTGPYCSTATHIHWPLEVTLNKRVNWLCPQVGPSQPSLQMQVKVSPPPTQVPPLEQGLEAQVLFLALGWRRRMEMEQHRRISYFKWNSSFSFLVKTETTTLFDHSNICNGTKVRLGSGSRMWKYLSFLSSFVGDFMLVYFRITSLL